MGPSPARVAGGTRPKPALSAFLDTNVLIRHLTADPPDQGRRATRLLEGDEELLLVDLIVAECVYVLESFYEVPRERVAALLRAAIALPAVRVVDSRTLLRALELYEVARIHFAEAYLAASAEVTGVGAVASFDRGIDRVPSVRRLKP